MHSGNMTELNAADLNEAERDTLLEVMQRAKEFDQQTSQKTFSGPLEGQLNKWTNPLKGWQPRWFYVDQQQGVLHYYTSEDRRKHPPRGSLHLYGAVVAPSEEDSQSFSVNGINGEIYKLRGLDAKERQYWVSRLRREVEICTNQSFGTPVKETLKVHTSSGASPSVSAAPQLTQPIDGQDNTLSPTSRGNTPTNTPTRSLSKRLQSFTFSSRRQRSKVLLGEGKKTLDQAQEQEDPASQLPGGDAMLEVLTRLQCYQESLVMQLETYSRQAGIEPLDKDVLLLKATSQAALHSVKDCLALMKLQEGQKSTDHYPSGSTSSMKDTTSTGAQKTLTPEKAAHKMSQRPRSTSNLDDFFDSGMEPRERTESAGKVATTPKRSLTTTAV